MPHASLHPCLSKLTTYVVTDREQPHSKRMKSNINKFNERMVDYNASSMEETLNSEAGTQNNPNLLL